MVVSIDGEAGKVEREREKSWLAVSPTQEICPLHSAHIYADRPNDGANCQELQTRHRARLSTLFQLGMRKAEDEATR